MDTISHPDSAGTVAFSAMTDPAAATAIQSTAKAFNHTRIHSSLNYRTPAEVEDEYYSHNHITAEQPLAAELTV